MTESIETFSNIARVSLLGGFDFGKSRCRPNLDRNIEIDPLVARHYRIIDIRYRNLRLDRDMSSNQLIAEKEYSAREHAVLRAE